MTEVASYPPTSQFESGESAYECGFFSCALQKAAGRSSPTRSAEWVDQTADAYYMQFTGYANTPDNQQGMSIYQELLMLADLGIFYRVIGTDKAMISAWLSKYHAPVLVTVDETSVYDLDEEGVIPYGWVPSGTHILTLTDCDSAGDFTCRDTANVASVTKRGGVSHISGAKLVIHQAVVCFLPWIPVPAAGYDPTSGGFEYKYTIQPGDTLWGIGGELGISAAVLLATNEKTLDQAARDHGYRDSNRGKWIFPGTQLVYTR